ncbi:TSUP family transporter [Microbacterium sp. EYE_5]|uniref:sulfite exporter TauE/SafE family protein n=1 Tax=unclassified Microbacterium TaxID=2609290 RepID=UPI002004CCC2|nr:MULTISPECIES: TSUP family transporter [unclassified Microbacterium]MCK6081842.1 TSUP family transporter [Microbacterium sp. EYE_382]MCK6087112.1 TSUP family transporter [Microbacterium sp. EYE_384]MCK6124910.1 TSUP family transporter [Microbacterium sp. EYE_80]MCK6127875.1 TSUP family transporter [Microbacterium sp. EYE_79]MCK6142796.1 TSUP family transporter [Microbacterium sp. EYE_39]
MLDGPLLAEWLPVSAAALAFLIAAAGVAGWVDAVVGGGGLIQLPALVVGVPKDVATPFILGTNKLSSFFGTLSASWVYLRRVRVHLTLLIPLVLGACSGSAIGAALSRYVPRDVLTPVVLVAVVAVAVYTLLRPQMGLRHEPRHTERRAIVWRSALIGAGVGFYDGILGPGTGSFFVILLVGVLGFGFLQASVNAKIANLTTNLAALAVYGVHGEILLVLGVAMAAANMAGGFVGARMATRGGSRFVRIVFLVVLSLLIVKLAWDTVVSFLPA